MSVIEVRGLAKEYRGRRVVDRFDMTVMRGDIYGFVGKNGAGKSTVMKMICGLVTPTAGEICLFGDEERAAVPGGLRVGSLIEEPGLLPNLSVFDNLMAKALAIGFVDSRERCLEVLRLAGLDHAEGKKAKRLSLGMKQRLGLALALLGNPDVLLLDEPFNGLDPEGTRAMRNLLVRLNEVFGVTVVVSSHVLDQLDRMVTRYGVIAEGAMVREMTADQVQAECGESLRVRTTDPSRTLAQLQETLPAATYRAEPDQAIIVSGAYDAESVAQALKAAGQVVLEFSPHRRDLEEYFVELMEGRRHA